MRKEVIGAATLYLGDCREVMILEMADNSVDSIVTDPPYELGFMGKSWDASGIAYDVDMWREAVRVLKPGGHLLAFSGSRTYHRMVVAIEDAGFEIRDQIMWLYGSGFPKSLDVSKAIDKAAGVEREVVGPGRWNHVKGTADQSECLIRPGGQHSETKPATPEAAQWSGWGTALKPAHEPIVVARKPLGEGTVAANVLAHGTGALNIDGCRIGTEGGGTQCNNRDENGKCRGHQNAGRSTSGETFHGPDTEGGRWPANVIHDGSDEVVAGFPESNSTPFRANDPGQPIFEGGKDFKRTAGGFADSGSAARFFYCAKASKRDRGDGNVHPTVKPEALMRYLCRLVTPPGGTVFDPFTGSGSTGKAAVLEGFGFIGAEMTEEYFDIAAQRVAVSKPLTLF